LRGRPAQGEQLSSKETSRRGEQAELRMREGLRPLGERERPPVLLLAVVVAGVLAAAVIVGVLTIHGLTRRGGSAPGGIFLAGVLAALAIGMYRRRYWAVLSFEALLAFQILVTSLALVVVSGLQAAALCSASIVFGAWLFWKLVRVMGRIQAGARGSTEKLR
jgi:hypothetical protein